MWSSDAEEMKVITEFKPTVTSRVVPGSSSWSFELVFHCVKGIDFYEVPYYKCKRYRYFVIQYARVPDICTEYKSTWYGTFYSFMPTG